MDDMARKALVGLGEDEGSRSPLSFEKVNFSVIFLINSTLLMNIHTMIQAEIAIVSPAPAPARSVTLETSTEDFQADKQFMDNLFKELVEEKTDTIDVTPTKRHKKA